MNDVLPDQSPLWEFFEDTVREVFRQYGYKNIRTPIVERTELFVRGVGAVTDIVEKEMYSFVDAMNGDQLSLRPEGTAPTVRAALEHNLLYNGPQRLWYSGPLFRHERPQKGRYRQYHTFGAEVLGLPGPDVDIELIVMARRLWQKLGIAGVQLQINTIGSAEERRAFREKLIAYFELHQDAARRRCGQAAAFQSAAHTRQQEPGNARHAGSGAEADRCIRRGVAREFRSGAGGLARRRHPFQHQSAPGARARLLQPHRL